MKISIMGTRGVPARYGGFETLAEELSVRLVKAGHDVTVYCRRRYHVDDGLIYKGVKLVVLPTINSKYFDTVVHTFLSVIHNVIFVKTDSVLLCNSANALFIPLLRLFGRHVAVNVDGLEWKRKKWNILGRIWYRLGERLAVMFANRVITDSRTIERYYKDKFGKETFFIPYGADAEFRGVETGAAACFGLEQGKYILYVGRLEPENNADAVIKAFKNVRTGLKLAIVGDAPYSGGYINYVKRLAGPGIVMCGAVYGQKYKEILAGAYFCVNACEVGGTHPAIVEAMAAGKLILVNDVPENIETIGDAGICFSVNKPGSLEKNIRNAIERPELIQAYGERARKRVKENYSWEAVCEKYLEILKKS